jgi:hypothetical protein
VTTASFSLKNMHVKHAGSDSPMRRFSINRIFHMNVISRKAITSQVNVTFFTLGAGAALLSGKHPRRINDSERGTLLHIRHLMWKEEKI